MTENRTATRLQIAAFVLIIPLAWFVYDGLRERNVNTGDRAPGFKVTTERGKVMTRSDFGGRVLVLNFWASWCPPCVEETPSMNALARDLAPRGVVVLGISVDQNADAYRRFLADHGVVFETALDPEETVNSEFGTFKYPETYVIRDGKVRIKYIGPRDWSDPAIRREIESLL
jgi:cytochrome c biogenesis protein CcmG, thiol:disulfide interchange protein DsbE